MQQVKKTRPERSAADFAQIGFAGFLMGICEIIPGVSGGTMAFILGIYEELINSIRDVTNPEFIKAATGFKIKRVFEILNWQFLGTLFVGMLVAIIAFAEIVGRLLETKPALIWSFFFGLVLASIILIGRRISKWTPQLMGIVAIVAISVFFIFGGSGITTPDTWWAFILSGAIAICAFILPGISGSFVLVLLGKYEPVLSAVRSLDIFTIALVGIGAILGLVTFARVVGWLFEKHHDIVVAALSGLMIGSLRVIWPWKENPHCLEEHTSCLNIAPALDSGLFIGLGLMVAGVVTILAIERFSNTSK